MLAVPLRGPIDPMDPLLQILLGLGLVLAGVALPLLMVLGMLVPTYLLCFVAFFSSLFGVLLGLVGAARYRREHGPDL